MEKQLKVKPALIEGSGGVFEIEVNKKLIYSKIETGEFPDNDQLIKKIKKQFAA